MPIFSKLPGTGLQWRSFATSLAVHVLALIMCFVNPELPTRKGASENPAAHSVPLFVPKASTPQPQSKQRDLDYRPRVADALHIQAELEPPSPEVRVDMGSVELYFADDLTNQLPDVLGAYNGMLALIDKDDPGLARYVIEPPDWIVRETMVDISRKVRFAMEPPQKWTLLRAIAVRESIALDHYQVCALFESPYKGCLQEAIRKRAAAMPGAGRARVQSARLAFHGGSPCGVDVLEVSFAPASVQ